MSKTQRRALRAAAAVCALTAVPAAMGATAPPAAPTNAVATAVTGGNTVTWTDVATDESAYLIERSLGADAWGVIGSTGPGGTSYFDPDFAAVGYLYRVRAQNDRGFSAYAVSNGVSRISLGGTFLVTVTATPTAGLVPFTTTLTAGYSHPNPATVTWLFGDGTTATGDTVTHTYPAFATYAATAVVTAPSILGPFGRDAGTGAAIVTSRAPALSAPRNLTASSPARSRVALAWTNPLSDATSIRVQRCVVRRCTTRTQLADLGGSATSYTDATAKSGTSYTYRLQVANAAGATATSNEVTIKTR